MTIQEIIIGIFQLYLDDTSELSSDQELALAERIHQAIAAKRPWLALRTQKTGVLSISVPYITIPDDFLFFAENNDYTEDVAAVDSDTPSKVIYVGDTYTPYKIVNYADRRKYRDSDGYAYLDFPARKIYFTKQPATAATYEYDYHAKPPALALDDEPFFPVRQDAIGYGMAVDGFIIQLFPKAQSYLAENQIKFNEALADIEYWDANSKV